MDRQESLMPSIAGSLAIALAGVVAEGDRREARAPGQKSVGEVFEWKSASGSPFEYFVPKGYDPQRGANLTVVLHGNGLDYRWTFWNHEASKFRPDDIVVSLEGTEKLASTGAFEFMAGRDSCAKVHAILEELKGIWKVNQTFLYGHSQGSFFVFEYAGEFPKDVDGVVGHAGALWRSSKLAKGHHGQAIALLHGTDDMNVPWAQSVDGRTAYREAGYPLVHLRTLWDWPHAPHWRQAMNQLAWCEGMTSNDPARIGRCLADLADGKAAGGVDPAACFAVAARLGSLEGASSADHALAGRATSAIDGCATRVAAAIEKELGKGKLSKVDGRAWLGMALRFLEDFDGVPACAAFAKKRASELAAVEEVTSDGAREFWQKAEKDPGEAVALGARLIEGGWRNPWLGDVVAQVEKLLADPAVKLAKKESARITAVVAAWRKGREEGFAAYAKLLEDLDP
jgi:predicted esterase